MSLGIGYYQQFVENNQFFKGILHFLFKGLYHLLSASSELVRDFLITFSVFLTLQFKLNIWFYGSIMYKVTYLSGMNVCEYDVGKISIIPLESVYYEKSKHKIEMKHEIEWKRKVATFSMAYRYNSYIFSSWRAGVFLFFMALGHFLFLPLSRLPGH
ncbi:hypothetical protein STEG23_002870 [Scotinomys teguina]